MLYNYRIAWEFSNKSRLTNVIQYCKAYGQCTVDDIVLNTALKIGSVLLQEYFPLSLNSKKHLAFILMDLAINK